jgi:hypothetical protein
MSENLERKPGFLMLVEQRYKCFNVVQLELVELATPTNKNGHVRLKFGRLLRNKNKDVFLTTN